MRRVMTYWKRAALTLSVALIIPILLAQDSARSAPRPLPEGPRIDYTAPIPVWSLVTFALAWGMTVLGYRIQFKKHKVEVEQQKDKEKDVLFQLIRSTCGDFWTDEDFTLKLERKIGNISERVADQKIAKEVSATMGLILTKEIHQKDMQLVEEKLKNMELSLKNTLLKEVIVLMNTKMVGGAQR
jgi:hypothetical protein